MEIEDSNTINEINDDDFVIDPVEIILPPSLNEPTPKKSKKSVKKKQSHAYEFDERLINISSKLLALIENTKNGIISKKTDKIAGKVWSYIYHEREKITPFSVIKIDMPSNFESLLNNLYSILESNKPEDDSEATIKLLDVDLVAPNLNDLIDVTSDELENFQEDEKRNAMPSQNKLVVILFRTHYSMYEAFLDDYMKYLSEEYLNQMKDTKFFLIFPSLTIETNLKSREADIIDLSFIKTKKVVLKILLNLLAEKSFVPFLSTKVLTFILHDLDYMNISFERIMQKFHLVVQDYLFSISVNEDMIGLVESIVNLENLESITYIDLRDQLSLAVTIFSWIEESIFKIKGKTGEKILDFLVKNEVSYTIPAKASAKIETLEQAKTICNKISELLLVTGNITFNTYAQMFIKMQNFEEISNLKKSKTKADKRFDALLSKGKAGNQETDEKEKLNLLKDKISQCLRLFLKEGILGVFEKIEMKYPNMVYTDVERLQRICYVDILEEYCNSFKYIEKQQPRKEVPIMFSIIQDFSLRVDTAQSFEAFTDLYQKHYPHASKDEVAQAFFVALNELKWMGMLSETRKSQISFEKNFFAKTLFRKMGTEKDKAKNEDDDDFK